MPIFSSATELKALVGQNFEPGDWLTVSQEMINLFAEATGDNQWIHVDVERAAKEAPGGTTIAHGYLTLSLIGRLMPPIFSVNAPQVLNYGVEGLRFLNVVPSGGRVRLIVGIKAVEEAKNGALKVTQNLIFEIEGQERPALIADAIFLYFT